MTVELDTKMWRIQLYTSIFRTIQIHLYSAVECDSACAHTKQTVFFPLGTEAFRLTKFLKMM